MLTETVEQLKAERRLNILMPISAVLALFSLVLFFIKSDRSELIKNKNREINFLQRKLEATEHRAEMCETKMFNESQARINDYKALLKIQATVKKQLETLKSNQ